MAKTTVQPTATIGTAHHLSHKPSARPAIIIAIGITTSVSHGRAWADRGSADMGLEPPGNDGGAITLPVSCSLRSP